MLQAMSESSAKIAGKSSKAFEPPGLPSNLDGGAKILNANRLNIIKNSRKAGSKL